MKFSRSIDWITLTYTEGFTPPANQPEADAKAYNVINRMLGGHAAIAQRKSLPHYRYVYNDDTNMLTLAISTDVRQGMMMTITGKYAQHMVSNFSEYLLNFVEDGWKCTRLDVAWDYQEPEGNASDTLEELDEHYKENMPRTYNPIWREGRLETIYVGSRHSSVMMRAYNKAKERNIEGYWLRLELELKDKWAWQALAFALQGDFNAVTNKLVDFMPITSASASWLMTKAKEMSSGEGSVVIGRKEGDKAWWMYQQVRPALLNWAKLDYMAFRAYVRLIAREALDSLPVTDDDIV